MKKLLLLLLLSSQANALTAHTLRFDNEFAYYCTNGSPDKTECMISTTTSLPTVLIGDEVELDSEEVGYYLIAEFGEEEAPVSDSVARKFSITRVQLEQIIMELELNARPLTLSNIEVMASRLQ